ncbi:MAG: putative metal-dependent hydrolase, TIM-barrel fold [Hyphomicrobiales bacterium]|nr:putative metal-dependent hydrolase, TIM-barrel fold [Hyphomicrobiales bacterium]
MLAANPQAANPLVANPIVDCHAHVYTRSMPTSGTAWHLPPADATIEDYIKTLDAHGVHFAVLAAASIYGDYNDYALEAVRRHKRLRTTVIVSPDIDLYAMRRMKEDGVVGVRFQFRNVASPPDLSSFEYRRLMRRIADLDWHVHLHDEGERLPNYIETIEACGPKLVIDHFGRPTKGLGVNSEGFQAVLRSIERGNTWVKASAAFRIEPAADAAVFASALLKHAGPERLLWGSDWPFAAFETSMTYGKTLEDFSANFPDESVRRAIDLTALKFYFS